jgi:hypothetical protein
VNNIGLLVRTAGVVTHVDTNWFTISDGSGAVDSDSNPGVKVSASGFVPSGLEEGDFVSATGVSTAERGNNLLYPVVLARDSDDFVAMQQ